VICKQTLAEHLHSPTPIGPGDTKGGMLISGYYAPEQPVILEAFLGVWGGAKRRAGASRLKAPTL
jgi:hypothetical protein